MTKFTTFRSLGIISGLCLAMLAPSIASAMVIDAFTDFESVTRARPAADGTTTAATQVGLGGVINGGDRTASVSILAGSVNTSGRATRLGISAGELGFSNDTGIIGSFTLSYSNIGAVDASAPMSALSFIVIDNDASGGTFSLELGDGMNSATDTKVLPGLALGQINFLINPANYGAVNLGAITSIVFSYTSAAQSGDLAIRNGLNLTTVPEPSSIAIALVGFGMAGVYFRRRRKQLTA